MRLTILSIITVVYSAKVLALPTQRPVDPSYRTPSLVVPQITSTSHQNNEQQQSSSSGTQDHISIDANSAKASADRIRKIVAASLAARRATTPVPRYKIKSNHRKIEGHENSETSNRNNLKIADSNKSMIQGPRSDPKINPVKINHQIIKVPNKSTHSVSLINNAQTPILSPTSKNTHSPIISPTPKTQIRHHKKIIALPSHPAIQKSSDSETSDNDKYQSFKYISPWERRKGVEREIQFDDILKLVGRPALPFNSIESMETHEKLSNSKEHSVIRPTFISARNKNVEENISSPKNSQIYRNKTSNVSNSNGALQTNLKSFRIDVPKQMIIELEENTNRPKTITVRNENVEVSTTSEIPVHVKDNSQIADQIQPIETNDSNNIKNLYQVPLDHVKVNSQIADRIQPIKTNDSNNIKNLYQVPFDHVKDNSQIADQIQPIETNDSNNIKNLYQVPFDQNKSHHDSVLDSTKITTNKPIENVNNHSDINESSEEFVELGTLENVNNHSEINESSDEFVELGTLENNFNKPDEYTPVEKDLSSMIVDLLFKMTGFDVK